VPYARRSSEMSVYGKVILLIEKDLTKKTKNKINSNLKFGADESSGIRQAKFVAQ
jgi:hypothetical protein